MSVNRTEDYMPTVDEFNIDPVLDGRPEQATASAVQSGWEAADKLSVVNGGDYPVEFRFNEGEFSVIKFLDSDGPFASYKQHFLQQKTVGKRSYVSLGQNDPLCTKLGSKPEDKRAFTIANLSVPGGPQRQMLIASPRLYKTLHAAHFSPQGPLNKNYWAISRTGKMQQTVYHLNAIKSRDLQEDWGIDQAVAETTIAQIKCFTRDDIKTHSWAELEEVANSLLS